METADHNNLIALTTMNMIATPYRSNQGSAGIVCAPLFHIGGAGSLFASIYHGQHTLLHKVFDPARVLDDIEQFLVTGLTLRLHVDECESYYHNLMSPEPGCFIVASQPDDSDDMPLPYLVSLSFDEVHAYLEGDEQVYSVKIPQQLYQWAEAYVLTNYVAIKKTKRKLKNWHESEKPGIRPEGKT